jgi:ATP-dependent DNA helicase RecG
MTRDPAAGCRTVYIDGGFVALVRIVCRGRTRTRWSGTKSVTTEELVDVVEDLRRTGTDTLQVEAKRAEHELPKRLWETLSAFANTRGGGVLVLGLEQTAGFSVVGVKNPGKVMQDLASLCGEMEPPIRAVVDLHTVEGATLVVAEVPETEIAQKPCYYRGAGLTNGAFIRVGDGDRKLSAYEVQVMLASRGQPREDEAPVSDASLDDLDPELVSGLLERLRQPEASYFRQLRDERALQVLKVLVRHQEGWVPSLGGLLALGTYPQQFFPALGVTFVAYPTPVLGEPGPRGERFLDNRRFDGPIPRVVRPVLDALERHMARMAVVRGAFREDEWEYPETAVREALVNALAHRDLSSSARGTPAQIHLFPDRLTIVNPGGLFGPVTVDRLGEEGISSTRNQVLMKLLEDTTTPDEGRLVCENRGSGIGAMLAALQRAGLPAPQFVDRVATFEVTFRNPLVPTGLTPRAKQRGDRQSAVLALLRERGELTRAEVAEALGVSDIAARKWLAQLRTDGRVETTTKSARSPHTRYRLVDAE